MGKIEKILKKGPVEGQTTEVYPVTSTKAVYDENNKRLDNIITGLQESVYLNNPIPISSEDTPEANAQNVKNIADYVEKAKAAGIADVNGMAVTCIIDDDYSGMGYLYSYDDSFNVQGVLVKDDLVENKCFGIFYTGKYSEVGLITNAEGDIITSSMLVQGARNPIIFTPDTTEVDEETYQKLLSDDVDVMFNTSDGNLCTLTYAIGQENYLSLYFTCFSVEGGGISDSYLYAYQVDITKTSPHTCSITEYQNCDFESLLDSRYLRKSVLNLILQEIDLRGTDAERKARLGRFETDWKELTGASNLIGARFVGRVDTSSGDSTMVFTWNDVLTCYTGVGFDDTNINYMYMIQSNGTIYITPLFSHLEAITIQTFNIPANKKKNIDAIQAYVNNLQGIGVDVTKGYIIPIKTVGFENGVGVIYPNTPVDKSYKGICIANGHSYIITISQDGTWDKQNLLDTGDDYTILNTSAKDILGAINEINTLANNKQDTLTSGTNIKTINNQSLLGSGNIEISAPSITVDTTMSDTSTNPVQNKVIKAYIDGLVGNVAAQLAQI